MLTVKLTALSGLLLAGAIFGLFYAWVCSTMWGLDAADPRVAIAAMQAMNASVRNAVFAPAFFGTPFVLLLAGYLAIRFDGRAALLFASAGLVYLSFGAVLTLVVNVPMNETLAQLEVPTSIDEARSVWLAYSTDWQFWNQMRTIASGIALLLCGAGLLSLPTARGL